MTEIYTADPSAHVFGGKIYVYPSHDVPTNIPDDDLGSEYAMHDYRVLRMDHIGGPVTMARSRSTSKGALGIEADVGARRGV